MSFKVRPLLGGILALVAGTTLIALFAPTDHLIAYAQVSSGILGIVVGLYLVLVVSWQDPEANDPRTPRLYTLVRREVRGRALRTVASGTAVAVLVGVLFSTMLLTNGAAYSIDSTRNKLGADIIVVPRQSTLSSQPFYTLTYVGGSALANGSGASYSIPPYVDGSVVKQLKALSEVGQVAPQLLITYFQPSGGCGGLNVVYLVGIDPTSDFLLRSWLGGNVSRSLDGNGSIAGAEVPALYQLPNQGEFYGVKLEQQATLPKTGTFLDHMIFVSMNTASRMLQWQQAGNDPTAEGIQPLIFKDGQISAVFVKLGDGVKATDATVKIQSDISLVRAYTFDSLVKAADVQYSGLLSIFSISGVLVWGGVLALLATIASLTMNERRGEMGLIRALGGSRQFMQKLIATQTILTISVAGLIAILAVWIVFSSPVIYDSILLTFKMPYVVPAPSQMGLFIVLTVLIVITTGGVAAIVPARMAAKMDVYEAIRKGAR